MRFSFRRGIQGCAWRAELGFRFGCVCPQVPPRLCSLTTDVHHLRPHLTQDDGQGSSEKYKWGCLSIKVPEGFLGRPMFWGVQRSHWGQLYMPWVVSWNYNVNATDFLSLLFRIPPWSGWSIKTPIILQSYPSSPPPHPKTNDLTRIFSFPAPKRVAHELSRWFLWSCLAGFSSFSLVHLFSQSEHLWGPRLHWLNDRKLATAFSLLFLES